MALFRALGLFTLRVCVYTYASRRVLRASKNVVLIESHHIIAKEVPKTEKVPGLEISGEISSKKTRGNLIFGGWEIKIPAGRTPCAYHSY